ncbi:MAG: PilZ domain-containing protein [Pyrinomonadaceae bacterium]
MQEKRKHPRVPMLLDVTWEDATSTHQARTGDISLGGCFIDTVGQATVGETISFRLRLPSGEWIGMQGDVRWELPGSGFGVKFKDLSDESQKEVAAFVKARG